MVDTVSCMRVESGRKRGEGVKSYPKKWGKLFERYLDEYLPERKDEICARADKEYRKLLTQMPDIGGKENMMASNMETGDNPRSLEIISRKCLKKRAFLL